jgi:hypothetical protein
VVGSRITNSFWKENEELKNISAIDLSIAVFNNMTRLEKVAPNYVAWGTVVPNLIL